MKHFIIVFVVCLFVTLCFRSITIYWKLDGQIHSIEVGAVSNDKPKFVGKYKQYEEPPVLGAIP